MGLSRLDILRSLVRIRQVGCFFSLVICSKPTPTCDPNLISIFLNSFNGRKTDATLSHGNTINPLINIVHVGRGKQECRPHYVNAYPNKNIDSAIGAPSKLGIPSAQMQMEDLEPLEPPQNTENLR